VPFALAPRALADGAVVRGAQADDVPAMLQIERDREGEADAVDLELVAKTPGGLDGMSVVEIDNRVVSMATLLDETLRVGGTTLRAGQVEMVATANDAEGRGYVRALMQRCHALSNERGHVLQVMIGIPHFYRQFGYAYSIPMHPWATLTPGMQMPAGHTVATANLDELAVCQALQDVAQAPFDIAMPHSNDCWRWLFSHTSSSQMLARDASGAAVGLARVYADDGDVDMGEITATTSSGTDALISHALSVTSDHGAARVNVRPHVPGLEARTHDAERRDWYYVRIDDQVQLLTALSPEFIRRLQGDNNDSGEALLSFWGSHVRLLWDAATLSIEGGGPMQSPIRSGGSGLPPDALGSLLFGGGAASLEDRFPDAYLGRQEGLMHTLFPPQSADLLTFYLPS
jgi:predicted N-acetyltransferase YhbS